MPNLSPCTLRIDPVTGFRGNVHSQLAADGNTYNQNFRNRFCGCGELYDPHTQKGTMYQCLGLATEADGGCGEDWWHPECLMGLPHDWYSKRLEEDSSCGNVETKESQGTSEDQNDPVPPGFPDDDHIEAMICYKCTKTAPWIKQYAGDANFTALTYPKISHADTALPNERSESSPQTPSKSEHMDEILEKGANTRKRKAAEDISESSICSPKRVRAETDARTDNDADQKPAVVMNCARVMLPPPPIGLISLVPSNEDFRTSFCRCPECYPLLSKYPQLLEEEDIYEPPLSESGENGEGGNSVGTGSLLDRGEAALSNVDRVRAIGNYNGFH